jgi:hypothetical protein
MPDVVITWTADLLQHAAHLGPVIPNPGNGEAPPFGAQATRLLKWAMWGALFFCVGGFIIIGGRMGISHKRGEGGSHMGSMAIVGFACVLIVTAYSIVQQLVKVVGE